MQGGQAEYGVHDEQVPESNLWEKDLPAYRDIISFEDFQTRRDHPVVEESHLVDSKDVLGGVLQSRRWEPLTCD